MAYIQPAMREVTFSHMTVKQESNRPCSPSNHPTGVYKQMKKLVSTLLIVLLLSISFTATAFASESQPAGRCAPAFELHHYMAHTGDDMHTHIGVDQDLNGDGFICMKIISDELHLHVDNSIPLK